MLHLTHGLGDQAIDPGLMRDLSTLIYGAVQDWYDACATGNCDATTRITGHPWWPVLNAAHGRIVNRIGRDDLRPRDFSRFTPTQNIEAVDQLVGGLYFEGDPQGLTRSKVDSYDQLPLVQRWLDQGPSAQPATHPWRSLALWSLGAAALGGLAGIVTSARRRTR